MLKVNSLDLYQSEKILSFNQAGELIRKLQSQGKTVGLCHGGFDLLHPGHIKHFESAKKLCDVLFVSVTSDRFVASRKGSGRPVYTDKLRVYMIANLSMVDYVVITDFAKGVEVINLLKPSFYIKGPDFINKTTPGITAEREAIQKVGGEMRYTIEPPMSTTKIIEYIKNEVDKNELLIVIDRDGTLIENDDFFGKNNNWKEELKINNEVVSFLSYLQTKYKTTKIVVTNQAGVARGYFDCQRVEEINSYLNSELAKRGIKIDNWQYCPEVDQAYAESKKKEINFDWEYVKEKTKRKPFPEMVFESLKELGRDINEFSEVIVVGDKEGDDGGLAKNLKGKFIDVKGKRYKELMGYFS